MASSAKLETQLQRHKNISKMLAGMDPDMQKSIVDQGKKSIVEKLWASMDHDTRAAMLPKLDSLAVELDRKRACPTPAPSTVDSKRHHPSGVGRSVPGRRVESVGSVHDTKLGNPYENVFYYLTI